MKKKTRKKVTLTVRELGNVRAAGGSRRCEDNIGDGGGAVKGGPFTCW